MTKEELKIRTRKFAIDVFNLIEKLPNKKSTNIISNQLGRCASSVAANYRAACRGRSRAEFISKIGIVEEEADETVFWLDMLCGTQSGNNNDVDQLLGEAKQLTAIFTATGKTAKQNKQRQ